MTEENSSAKDMVRVEVSRSDPDARSTFFVERTKPMMILDVLLAIRREQEPSIGFRHSCRVAMCNICGVRVDGEPTLACQTPLEPDCTAVRIEPLDGRVLRDLVIDIDQFVDEWQARSPGN